MKEAFDNVKYPVSKYYVQSRRVHISSDEVFSKILKKAIHSAEINDTSLKNSAVKNITVQGPLETSKTWIL